VSDDNPAPLSRWRLDHGIQRPIVSAPVHRHVLVSPGFVSAVHLAPHPTVLPHRVDVVGSLGLDRRVFARHVLMIGPLAEVETCLPRSDGQLGALPDKRSGVADAHRAVH